MNPKVSVIIPTYNRPHLIGRAIKSVLNQTYQDFEIIIIDGSPNNETEKVIQPYLTDSRIHYFHEPDVHTNTVKDRANIAKARNKAVRMAKGEYIAPLDDDDFWCNQKKLEKQVKFLENNSDYALCGGGVIGIYKENLGKSFTITILYPERNEDVRKIMLAPEGLIHSTVVFRKDDWKSVDGYDEKHSLSEEWDLHLKLGKIGKFYNFQEYFTAYVEGEHVKQHIIKYRRKCILSGIRLNIKYWRDYPDFHKYCFYLLVSYFYSFLPVFLRKLLFPMRSKIKISFRKSFGVSERKIS